MGANDAQEMLDAAKAECVRLERENATLRADLDARFEHSDHLSAKYYRRMRDAERAGDRLREQLAEAQKQPDADDRVLDLTTERAMKAESSLAEAQATIEEVRAYVTELSDAPEHLVEAHHRGMILRILSAPSSTGGNDRPEIVCLCGSTRFYDEFQAANYMLTMQGKIVLSVGFYPHAKAQHGHGEGVGHDSAEKVALDELHKRKIDLADRVFVLNVGGYIGDSTRGEIEYAIAHGKPVDYDEPIGGNDHA